mmetsp:Transcript_26559/g.73004  ORF Transcript_26559/g.73004 Transcript_26559/m.73004 type:complete len:131 (-) Transcript_26559:239-631(-)
MLPERPEFVATASLPVTIDSLSSVTKSPMPGEKSIGTRLAGANQFFVSFMTELRCIRWGTDVVAMACVVMVDKKGLLADSRDRVVTRAIEEMLLDLRVVPKAPLTPVAIRDGMNSLENRQTNGIDRCAQW